MKISRLLLSKWFYYILISIGLILFWIFLLPLALGGEQLAANFLAEVFGLLFTLVILVMILDYREWLEWKSVEHRVRKRIQGQILGLFAELSIFCKMKGADSFENQLNRLASEKIELTKEAKSDLLEYDLRRDWEWILDSRRKNLSEIEAKYLRFLDSEIQASLMDIQDYLNSLCIQFRLRHTKDEDFVESFSSWTGKIMKEVLKLKRKGIWLNP